MADEIKEVENKTIENNYLETIKELQGKLDNSVSKDEYNKAVKQNADLLNALTENRQLHVEKETSYTQEDIDNCARKLQTKNLSNKQYAKTLLQYRDAVKDVYGEDVFVNPAMKVELDQNDNPHLTDTRVATEEDYAQADALAEQLKSLIDESKSDREFQKLFTYGLK